MNKIGIVNKAVRDETTNVMLRMKLSARAVSAAVHSHLRSLSKRIIGYTSAAAQSANS
jgi:hypothetical protein